MQNRPLRALLFVPATRPDLFAKAAATGADALVLDLEDAVTEDRKAEARQVVADAIGPLAETGLALFVRINDLETPHWHEDLQAVTQPGLTGVAPPKVNEPADIARIEQALAELEQAAGIPPGTTDIQPLLETARGMHDAFAILSASPRIRSYFGGFARDGDVSRELGACWTPSGDESLYLRSKLLLDGRAAGVPYPISGTWADVRDLDGLARYAEQNRDLGYTGMYVIHPSHVETVNRAFTPTPAELAWYRRIIDTLAGPDASADGAVQIDGVMIDRAMVEKARAVLDLHATST